MAIQLPPSTDTNVLTNAIETATVTNQALILLPGVHLTKPGYNLTVPIGPNGLSLNGAASAVIQRRDHSIGDNLLHRTDNNFGIFLVPTEPTAAEVAGIQWQTFQSGQNSFEYGTVTRGRILISGVILDCNMGNQGLDPLHKAEFEHSAMLAIAGHGYAVPLGPQGQKRMVFVAFEDVRIENVTLKRGGFADDIWFPPGYFRPNIAQVELSHLVSQERVNQIRASVSFSGLSQRISIDNCQLDSLHCEVDPIWSEDPGPAGAFEPSLWVLDRVQASAMAFAAKGAVVTLQASRLNVTETFQVNEAAGAIIESRLAVTSENRRFFRLRSLSFRDCTWVLTPDSSKRVNGLILMPKLGQPCVANFDSNAFVIQGSFQAGELITTGQYSSAIPGNEVAGRFTTCQYPAGFGAATHPDTHIAVLHERGQYTFTKSDFVGLDLHDAIESTPPAQISETGGSLSYRIV